MSGDQYVARVGGIGLAITTPLCVLALNTTAGRPINIEAVRVSALGGTAGSVLWQLARITNTPTGGGAVVTLANQDNSHGGSVSTGLAPTTANPGVWTTAPVAGSILWEEAVPIGGGWAEWWTPGMEIKATVSDWIGVFATATVAVANTTTPNGAYANLVYTE